MTSASPNTPPRTSPDVPPHAGEVPSWMCEPQDYAPLPDRDGFVTRSILSMSSVLARLRLDDGAETRLSPSAPAKLVGAIVLILLTSLARNYLFVLIMLAAVLVRAAFLPRHALARTAATASAAALVALVLMLPAALLGQPRSAITLATKALVTTGLAMEVALTTPSAQLTGALRAFLVPNVVILTVDLALRSIVRLGEAALEVLTALQLRSVGRNTNKQGSMGGVGGVVLVKAARAAQDTSDAMRCRGFEGSYDLQATWRPRLSDALWASMLVAVIALFIVLQRQV